MLRKGVRYFLGARHAAPSSIWVRRVANPLALCIMPTREGSVYQQALGRRPGALFRRARGIRDVNGSNKRKTTNWDIPLLLDIFRRNISPPIFAVFDLTCCKIVHGWGFDKFCHWKMSGFIEKREVINTPNHWQFCLRNGWLLKKTGDFRSIWMGIQVKYVRS